MTPAGLPHWEIPGSTVVCTSPRLIAAYHVLHRFPEPRHPPYALSCLTSISSSPRTARGPGQRARGKATKPPPCRQTARRHPPTRSARRGNSNIVSTNSLGASCQRTSGSRPASRRASHLPDPAVTADCSFNCVAASTILVSCSIVRPPCSAPRPAP